MQKFVSHSCCRNGVYVAEGVSAENSRAVGRAGRLECLSLPEEKEEEEKKVERGRGISVTASRGIVHGSHMYL